MKFIKDILFFEITTTGNDPDKDNIIQLSGILLGKENLLEKNYFNSYVRVSYLDSVINEHANFLQIDPQKYRKSPKIYDAVKQFNAKFGKENALLATGNVSNLFFLRNAFRKTGVPFEYDMHIIDLWTLGYVYTLNYGLKKIPTFNTFLDYFKLKIIKPTDSLEKAKTEVEVLKKIIKEV
jgi:DNA polymerase III alpha subunit (gram-positive type)